MKQKTLLYSLLLTLPLCAATQITVNRPLTETLTNAQVVSIVDASEIKAGSVVLLTTAITFTLPDETPLYEEVKAEKLALAADTDGTILIADGTTQNWVTSSVVATADTAINVSAKGYLNNGVLTFDVTLNNEAPITVTAPSSGTMLSAVELSGEGSAEDLTLALVDTAMIPGDATSRQDPALISKYITWLNDAAKGGAMASDATSAEIADAFAMNVCGTPTLEIIAIDTINHTLTVRGTTTDGTSSTSVPLKEINGRLYLVYSSTLNGVAKTLEAVIQDGVVTLSTETAETLTLELPEEARFVKALIALDEPTATLL